MPEMITPYSFDGDRLKLRDSRGEVIMTFGADDAIGVAYDSQDGTLLQHGSADVVQDYADRFRASLAGKPHSAMLLDGLKVMRIPVVNLALAGALDELNAAIEIAGRVKTLSARLSAIMAPSDATIQ